MTLYSPSLTLKPQKGRKRRIQQTERMREALFGEQIDRVGLRCRSSWRRRYHRGRPFADGIDRQDRGFVVGRAEKSAGCVRH